MQSTAPADFYQEQIEKQKTLKKKLLARKSGFSWLRFILLLAAFIAPWQLWNTNRVVAFLSAALFLALFIYIVTLDLKNKEALENIRRLISINQLEIEILNHHYLDLPDGSNLEPSNHPYANDLDIFGKASLYQYINRTQSEQGSHLFSQWLLEPSDPTTILQRQAAVIELSKNPEWSQQLQAYGMENTVSVPTQDKIGRWRDQPNRFTRSRFWKVARILFPGIALFILGLFLFGRLEASPFIVMTVILLAVAYSVTRVIMPYYLQVEKIVPELESLSNSIRWIENSPFQSEYFKSVKQKLSGDGQQASDSIRKLKNILERFEYRFNPLVHIPLNIFLFWDLQQVWALENWKKTNKANLEGWFDALAESESLVSLATLSFNQPTWPFAKLNNGRSVFIAEELGHPLIAADKRVTSSFSTIGEKQLNLITGSNMAGKSTFLRSVGVNIILAMMGAPSCCKNLEVSHMKVISSMRISDNLEENTSTFYAELKKLKEIIEAVNNHEPVFLLLDEILRGTNSTDRHIGSIALIRQLIRENGSGLIATHDLELAKLTDEFPNNLHNYHFDVQVNGEELYFDYKLKDGICKSMNASLLMKKIGIELDTPQS